MSAVLHPPSATPHHYHKWVHSNVNIDLLVGEFELQSNTPSKTQGVRKVQLLFVLLFVTVTLCPRQTSEDNQRKSLWHQCDGENLHICGVEEKEWLTLGYVLGHSRASILEFTTLLTGSSFQLPQGWISHVCLNLSFFDFRYNRSDWPAGVFCWLLSEHEADKLFQPWNNEMA